MTCPRWGFIIRHLQLWLLLLLCWFVLRGNPATQESQTTTEDVFTDEVYPEAGTLQKLTTTSTPHLPSFTNTEAIISASIDPDSLVVTPAIAPATPIEDIKISSSISDSIVDLSGSPSHSKEKSSEAEENSQTLKLNEAIEFKASDKELIDEALIDEAKSKVTEDMKDSERDFDDFDLRQPAKIDDSGSEMPAVEGGSIDNNISHISPDSKQNETSQNKESRKHGLHQGMENLSSSEENANSDETSTPDQPHESPELFHASPEESQIAEGEDDLAGPRDDLEGSREDMPSFKEWSQKFLELEEQKNKEQQINEKGSADTSSPVKKKKSDRKQNNYASVDCGAKILEKNVEAQNAESILLENKDFYMLNPCSASIWFIVELCDHVHVTSLELANFEMFSSTIEKFQVSFSTRYPTREWSQLQTFTAKSEKSVQTFNLDPIFAKYIKVEQLSYHGSEHYCPWSLLRVYGNSMVEEYEEHESSQNSHPSLEEDESASSSEKEEKEVSNGILKSATEAVLNFVKETAKKLVNTEITNSTANAVNQTNFTNVSSSSQTSLNSEVPKTIVQLMNREDFEAGCHEATDEVSPGENTKCLHRTACDSTENTYFTYETFFEIIHNVCRRNLRNSKACFANLSRMFANNRSVEQSLRAEPEGHDTASEKFVAAGKDETGKKPTQTEINSTNEQQNSEKIQNPSSSDVIDRTENPGIKSDASEDNNLFPQTSSLTESEEPQAEKKADSASVIPPILPNSSSHGSSSSVSSNSGAPIPSITHEVERPPSPTPLPQPPLAVPKANSDNTHSEQTVTNSEKGGNDQNLAVLSTDERKSASIGSSAVTVTVASSSKSSAAGHVTNSAGTVSTEASVTSENLVPGDVPGHPVASDKERDTKGDHVDQLTPGSDGGNFVSESVRGTGEEKQNPHVDVLKITLTDEETKEGTAEPEQANQDGHGLLDSSGTEKKEIVVEKKQNVDADNAESSQQMNSGSREEAKTSDILSDSEAKQHSIPKSQIEKKELSSEIVTPEDSKKREDKEAVFEQGESKKAEEKQSDSNQDNRAKIEEITTDVDHNIWKKDPLSSSEGTCDEREREAQTNGLSTGAVKKVEVNEITTVSVGTGESDPGPTIPASHGESNGKKESIFVAMSRKIKALEQNVTMTNLFLEELSQRYRKSLEEMQKKLEKKLSAMSKSSKLLTKVNLFQNSTILALTSRVEKLERELTEATLRLSAVNQEVVERHVLGMCFQFFIVFALWFLFGRTRSHPVAKTERPREMNIKYEPLKNGSVTSNGNVVKDMTPDKNSCLEEISLPKTPTHDPVTESKRRRRRRHRCDQFLDHDANLDQNIVSKTAGLLFHTPGCHEGGSTTKQTPKEPAQRSCSADSLNDIVRYGNEQKASPKRSTVSPKSKKTISRNGGKKETAAFKLRSALFRSDSSKPEATEYLQNQEHRSLARSKSVGDDYKNELTSHNNGLTHDPSSPPSPRCSLQSANDCHQNQKSRWIWGLG